MNLYSINTGYFKLDGGAMFGVVPKSIWSRTNPPDERNLCTWGARLLLIEDGKRLILVDTGLGNKQGEDFFRHYFRHGDDTLAGSLAKHGFHSDDITDVILTHLHFDHAGGAVIQNQSTFDKNSPIFVPAFKNAVYWSNEDHWNWALQPNPRERASFLSENILPIQESGQLKFIPTQDGFDFTDQIKIRFAHGHTEAMMLPQIKHQGKTLLYMADLLPSVGHIPLPYVMSYDVRPLQTMAEREIFWNEALLGQYTLFLEHDAQQECCTLQQTEKGIRVLDTFSLLEWK